MHTPTAGLSAPRVAIVTNAGGPGILAVDACEASGLTVAPFAAETRARLAAFLPPTASTANPVDMVASAGPDPYRQAIEVALTDPDTDALIVIFTPIDPAQSTSIVAAIREGIACGRRAGATTSAERRIMELGIGGRSGGIRSPRTFLARPVLPLLIALLIPL